MTAQRSQPINEQEIAELAQSIYEGHVRVVHLNEHTQWAPYKTQSVLQTLLAHAPLKARIEELEAKVAELHEAAPNCLFYQEQAEYWKQIARDDRAKAAAHDRCTAKIDCISRGEAIKHLHEDANV